MSAHLIAALRESRGYLRDQGWHETGRLLTAAANEIEHLATRVRALEEAGLVSDGTADLQTPPASNHNALPASAAVSSEQRQASLRLAGG